VQIAQSDFSAGNELFAGIPSGFLFYEHRPLTACWLEVKKQQNIT